MLGEVLLLLLQAAAEGGVLLGQASELVLHHLVTVLQALMGLLELGVLLQQLAMLSTRRAGLALRIGQLGEQLFLLIAQASELFLGKVQLSL
ncbi:hypothetical protein thsps21_18000 [Pseudomonas sp. No.21]